MRSWGIAVGKLRTILWENIYCYPQALLGLVGAVGKPGVLYTGNLGTVPTVIHGKNLAFQSVNRTVLPIIHTTYKNKDILNKLLIVNRSTS